MIRHRLAAIGITGWMGFAFLSGSAMAQDHHPGKPTPQPLNHRRTMQRSNLSLEEVLQRNGAVTHSEARRALWAALGKAWAQTHKNEKTDFANVVGIYAENRSATEICFFAADHLYTFDTHKRQIAPVEMQAILPSINAITFVNVKGTSGPQFILWHNGIPKAAIGATEKTDNNGNDLVVL